MKPHLSLDSVIRYLVYFGVPLAVTVTMCGLFNRWKKSKRRRALQGKVVVITGASSGIGEALAHAFYAEGSKVVLAARRESELERVRQNLISKYSQTETNSPIVMKLDLADLDSIEPFVQKIHDACGHIDILINNAGVSSRGSILESKYEVFKNIMYINYFGCVYLTKAALRKMVDNKSGHIVFVSSVQGLIVIPDRAAYAASKHAMQAFGDGLRAEMHQHNINVTVVSPGYVKTSISLNALNVSGSHHGVMDPETAKGFTPEYVADKIVDAVVDKKNELIISQFLPNLGIFLRKAVPSYYFHVMAKRAKKTE